MSFDSGVTGSYAKAFYDALLPATLRNAKRAIYYRETLADFAPEDLNYDSLVTLPFLDRKRVQQHLEAVRLHSGAIFDEIFTGGTTGAPLVVPVSRQEQEYIAEFHRRVDGELTSSLRRGIHLTTPFHAHNVQTPAPARLHKIGVYDAGSFEHARKLLRRTHQEDGVQNRCTFLIGIERLVRAFTLDSVFACQAWPPPFLDAIFVNSQYVSAAWRKKYEAYWGAKVIDRYGLTEVYGGATEDPLTGWYLFDPACVAEVVDVRTQRRLQRGVGEVVLTSLYPFQQELPMIRYLTGDLAEVTLDHPAAIGIPAIKPLGRIAQSLFIDDTIIPASAFYEVFDSLSTIARTELFRDAKQIRYRTGLGHPVYKVELVGEGSAIRVVADVTRDNSDGASEAEIEDSIVGEFSRLTHRKWPSRIHLEVVFGVPSNVDFLSYSP